MFATRPQSPSHRHLPNHQLHGGRTLGSRRMRRSGSWRPDRGLPRSTGRCDRSMGARHDAGRRDIATHLAHPRRHLRRRNAQRCSARPG
ncbi:hypothetical protein ACFPRL_23795 [Pseudoclavibacter helvolus]